MHDSLFYAFTLPPTAQSPMPNTFIFTTISTIRLYSTKCIWLHNEIHNGSARQPFYSTIQFSTTNHLFGAVAVALSFLSLGKL